MENVNFNDVNIFGTKTLADVFKDIYTNTKKKDKIIDDLIADLKPMVKTVTDAMQLIPYIKDYLDVGVKNNEHLIKMAVVVQRAVQASSGAKTVSNDDYMIPDAEKEELLKVAKEQQNLFIKQPEIVNKSNITIDDEPPTFNIDTSEPPIIE